MKTPQTTLTIEEAVAITTNALEKGVAPIMAQNCLMMDGFSAEKATKIVEWAKQCAEKEAS